jgi:hypothetical protein
MGEGQSVFVIGAFDRGRLELRACAGPIAERPLRELSRRPGSHLGSAASRCGPCDGPSRRLVLEDVSILWSLQRRQHELLKTGHAHSFLTPPYPTQDYMRKTPNRVGSTPALSVAENASDRTRRVSRGATMPSSQRRAVA